jgi:hypothetical protein
MVGGCDPYQDETGRRLETEECDTTLPPVEEVCHVLVTTWN